MKRVVFPFFFYLGLSSSATSLLLGNSFSFSPFLLFRVVVFGYVLVHFVPVCVCACAGGAPEGFAPVHVPSFVAMAASAFLVSPCTHLVGGKLANKGESRGRRGAVLTTTRSSREMVQCAVWQSRKGSIPGFPCSGFLGQQCVVRSVCSSRPTLKKHSLNSTLAKASLLVVCFLSAGLRVSVAYCFGAFFF